MAELKTKEEDVITADLASIPPKQPLKLWIERLQSQSPCPCFLNRRWEISDRSGARYRLVSVDEPRRTVEEADKLVAAVMQRLAEGFANERSGLEKQWDRGDNVSTEDLRLALQRYRSFFDRLLNL